MNRRFAPEDDAFRREVRAFIRDHYPREMRVPNPPFLFSAELRRRLQGKLDSAFFDIPEWPTGQPIPEPKMLEENTLMSSDTHQTARTQRVQVGDVEFAYRRFGRRGGLPLLFLNYFAANMDDWDPKVTNGFAAEREVILFDNAGVGSSTGETPSTVAAMTKDCG